MSVHKLKTCPIAWDAVASGEKRFEVRVNDRFFQRGDTVILERFDPDTQRYLNASGPASNFADIARLTFRIGWMLQGGQFGIEPGFCVFSLEPVPMTRPTFLPRRPRGTRWMAFGWLRLARWLAAAVRRIFGARTR